MNIAPFLLRRRWPVLLLAAVVSTSALAERQPRTQNPTLPPPGPGVLRAVAVRDLPYGDALYYFYLGDYATALERLQLASAAARMPHHEDDAKLLMGGIELSLGDYVEAARIFKDVLDRPTVPDNVHDRAHFYLGKIWYRRGYFAQAVTDLGAASRGTLPADFDAERRMLLAEALLADGKDADAAEQLSQWTAPSVWRHYAEFNLGVAQIRSGKTEAGVATLDRLGLAPANGEEELALRDQANVALGFAQVQQHRAASALVALARVRLEGPQANRALLGAGWAAADAGDYRQALAVWTELRGRDHADPAVQESFLAVPYAYTQLGAPAQAVAAYELALTEFDGESQRIDDAVSALQDGVLAKALVAGDLSPGVLPTVSLDKVPAGGYLYRLLARDDLSAALANWRDLATATDRLERRQTDLDAFEELLAVRARRFTEELPARLAAFDRHDLDAMMARRTDLEARAAAAEERGDLATLGTPRQRAIWARLQQMDAMVDRLGDIDDEDVDDIADRIDFLKGYLYWEMSDGFKSRLWSTRKQLRAVSRDLREAGHSAALITAARTSVPARNQQLQSNLKSLRVRVADTTARTSALRDRALGAVSTLAADELRGEKERIRSYLLEVRYSLAALYDGSSHPGDAAGRKQP